MVGRVGCLSCDDECFCVVGSSGDGGGSGSSGDTARRSSVDAPRIAMRQREKARVVDGIV